MKYSTRVKTSLIASSLMLVGPVAMAHHSGTMFDFMNCQSITGTVRALEWVYPHSWLWIDVAQSDGSSKAWGFEFPSPTQLSHIDERWTKGTVVKGDKVTVTFGPLKDGRAGGAMAKLTLPSGVSLVGSPGLCGNGDPNPAAGNGASSGESASH